MKGEFFSLYAHPISFISIKIFTLAKLYIILLNVYQKRLETFISSGISPTGRTWLKKYLFFLVPKAAGVNSNRVHCG